MTNTLFFLKPRVECQVFFLPAVVYAYKMCEFYPYIHFINYGGTYVAESYKRRKAQPSTVSNPMKISTEKILTTHVGSMPRPQNVVDYLFAEDRGDAFDQQGYDDTMRQEVLNSAKNQTAAGVDIISDGEFKQIDGSWKKHIAKNRLDADGQKPEPTLDCQ